VPSTTKIGSQFDVKKEAISGECGNTSERTDADRHSTMEDSKTTLLESEILNLKMKNAELLRLNEEWALKLEAERRSKMDLDSRVQALEKMLKCYLKV
jgi:hypothetical protein